VVGYFGKTRLKSKRATIAMMQSWLFYRWASSCLNCRECGWQV
jgi:hypothetical protein